MRTALAKARPVALVLHNDSEGYREWHLRMMKREATERLRVTPFLCHAIITALEEGANHLADAMLSPVIGHTGDDLLRRFEPTYTYLRDFLYREFDADYTLACTIALSRVASRNRRYRTPFESRPERGWL